MGAPDGLLIVDKPGGLTSHDVVARCRRLAGTRKVGHAGTLDPMATGVLVVGIGRATRLLGYVSRSTKWYDATIRLGMSTLSDDAEGEVLLTSDTSHLDDSEIRAAVDDFHGPLEQVPSSVSAIKVDGRRAYARVHAGEDVRLAARQVHVASLTVLDVRRTGALSDVDVSVQCSTGTYVRALARDIGAHLGVGGHLTALRRTRVAEYSIDDASTLDAMASLPPEVLPVIPLDTVARRQFRSYVVSATMVEAIRNGRPIQTQLSELAAVTAQIAEPDPSASEDVVALFGPDGRFLALYSQDGALAKAVAVFAPA
jgi:tRNA pseudouridine55 synthase